MLKISFLYIFFFIFFHGNAQKIEVIKIETLKTMMQKNDGIYVFNFWATYCKPCVKEMPHFEKLSKDFRQNGVKVIFVSLDFTKELEAVKRFAEEKRIESPIYLLDEPDYNSWLNQISSDWSGALPATLIIKETKKGFYEQEFDYQSLIEKVKAFF